jgi:AcrR family transcriptional regulator
VTDSRLTSANRILETALHLFATRGYDGTSVQEICDAAHITKPTLYHFYGSKEGVHAAIVASALESVRRSLFAALAQDGPLVERLKLVVRDVFDEASAHPKLWRFMSSSVWSPGTAPVAEAHCAHAEYTTAVSDAIEAAVGRGELTPGPTPVRVLVLQGAVAEALNSFLLFGEPVLTSELADQLVDAVFNGWISTPASVTKVTTATSSSSGPVSSSGNASPSAPLSASAPLSFKS